MNYLGLISFRIDWFDLIFEKEDFISGCCVSQGKLKFLEDGGHCECNSMTSGAMANPVSLEEETEAVNQRLVLLQLEVQLTSSLHCVQCPFLT